MEVKMYSNIEGFIHNTPQILKKKKVNKILHHVTVENEQKEPHCSVVKLLALGHLFFIKQQIQL